MVESIAAVYHVILKDHSGERTALFDDWKSLEFKHTLNGLGSYSLIFPDTGDPRFELFEIDSQIEIYRQVIGVGLSWYCEFEGFHRKPEYKTAKSGEKIFTSYGVDYIDLLARTSIAYKAGTIYADKSNFADDVMKDYVLENCGVLATGANRRFDLNEDPAIEEWVEVPGLLPGFSVADNTSKGINWEGSRAYENLLEVLVDISNFAEIDFNVIGTDPAEFEFRTYPEQYGLDKTEGNSDGNSVVIFDVEYGNVQDAKYQEDHLNESNVVLVLGKGEGATRYVIPRSDTAAKAISPWNRRETSRPATSQEFLAQFQNYGDEILKDLKAKEIYTFNPLQQPSSLYGLQYSLGDRVTVNYGTYKTDKKIVGVKIKVKDSEQIKLEFADISRVV